MKKYIFATLFFFLLISANGQGNLQFNKVITIEFTKRIPYNTGGGADTIINVPAGKIWKIESASSSFFTDTALLNINTVATISFASICINETVIFNPGVVSSNTLISFPIYLSSGTSYRLGIRSQATGGSYDLPHRIFLSILEFNVIP
jgi:hypothetical protein